MPDRFHRLDRQAFDAQTHSSWGGWSPIVPLTSPRNAPRAYPGPLRTEAFCQIPDTAQAPFRDDMKN